MLQISGRYRIIKTWSETETLDKEEKKKNMSEQLGGFRESMAGIRTLLACCSVICRYVCAESEDWVGRKRKKQWRGR